MAKDLILNVVATKQSKALTELAGEFQVLAKEAEVSGRKIDKNFTQLVDQQIAGTRKELAQLRQEFNKTGDLKIAGDISALERNLKSLEKLRKQFGVEGAKAGNSFGEAFKTDFARVLKAGEGGGIGGVLKVLFTTPEGLGVAIPAAGALGVTIGGAVLSGIGLAGVGAGIAGQLKSPVVTKAVGDLKYDLGHGFTDATSSFAEPVARGLSILDTGFKSALPGLKATFAELAPEVTVLAHGASGFLTGVVTGLEHAAVAAKPLLDDLGQWLPTFGKEVGGVFDTIANHQKEALDGLHSIEDFLSGVTIAAKGTVNALSGIYDVAKYAGSEQQLKSLTEKVIAHKKGLGDVDLTQRLVANSSETVAHALGLEAGAVDDVAHGLNKLNGELGTLLGTQLNVDQANDKFNEDLLSLKDNLDKHSRSLSTNSAAGLANRDVILQLIGDAKAARDAFIAQAGGADASKASIDQANATYDAAIKNIEAMGVKAGLSKKDLDALAGNYFVNVQLAIAAVNASGLAQNVTPHDVNRKGNARAAGGPVTAGTTYLVGENGPELFRPNASGVIIPKIPAVASIPLSSGWGSPAPQVVQPVINARIFVGSREITDLVRTELDSVGNAIQGGARL